MICKVTFETNKESSNLEYYEIKKPLMVTREEFGAEVCVSFFNLAEFFIPNSRKLSRRAFSGWATRMHSCQHRLPGVCSPKDNLTRILWGGFLEEDISRRIFWGGLFEESILIRDFDKRDIKATLAFVCTLHNDLVTKDSQCFFTAVAGLREVKILLFYFISCFFLRKWDPRQKQAERSPKKILFM